MSRYEATLSRCSLRDERAHLGALLVAGADLDLRQPLLDRLDQRIGHVAHGHDHEIAMQRSPAEPYAAETAASAAISISASGSTIMWFLAPPSAWTRLPCAVPVS